MFHPGENGGQQNWAVYAHLQHGSFRVKRGDRVRRGEVIARLGNSASYSPHLHFHIVDGPDPFSSEGVPFVFDQFTHEGKLHRDEMPGGLDDQIRGVYARPPALNEGDWVISRSTTGCGAAAFLRAT